MSQNAIHSVDFKVNVLNLKQVKERDAVRIKHHCAGHQPHNAKKGQHQPCGPSGSGTCIPVMNNGEDHHSSSSRSFIDGGTIGVTYLANIGLGNPATACQLLIDTGSSNTWVKNTCYQETSTCKDTRQEFSLQYGQGSTSGTLYTDQVTLCPTLVINNQLIGVAQEATDMDGVDGIMGIGPVCLTQGTITSDPSAEIPTVTDNCLAQKLINQEVIGISYKPTTDGNGMTGSLCFGGPDPKMCNGPISYVPITKTEPAKLYWGIDQSISYGGQNIMDLCPGIADTGTTLCMLPEATFQAYKDATGATLDKDSGLLCVNKEQFASMQSMKFKIGEVEYELTPNAQIWPRNQQAQLGNFSADQIPLIFASMGPMENKGLCFINGYAFLQRFYSVYDTTNSRVGFATTNDTLAETN
ncbi:acid protease [Mycena galopus ATCC 62051]|nr:acid protease [Mycena galopus ATCC 62051]